MSYGSSGTADVWLGADGSGAPVRSAQTMTLTKSAKGGTLVSRYIQLGDQIYVYNPEFRNDNTIRFLEPSRLPSFVTPTNVFDGASLARGLASNPSAIVEALPQQTLDGYLVDPVQINGGPTAPGMRTILYYDAHSYVLRGFDATVTDPSYSAPSWQARLVSEQAVAASAVPTGTFLLNAPAGAVVMPEPGKRALFAAFAAACHTSTDLKSLLAAHGSVLAACQAGNPGMTDSGLIAALSVPEIAQMDAAVAAGQITPVQEASGRATVQQQIAAFLNGIGG
jgi:hypothetical protein